MKRIFVSAFLFACLLASAQKNTLLNGNFWKNNPSITLVKEEISKGNNPAEANAGNHDIVSIAINNGADNEIVKYLIDQPGNSIDKTTHDGRLYIHWAANKGNIELVKYLIDKGSKLNRTDDKGATPLAFAAGNGQLNSQIYDLFFKAGIDVKATYKDGATLLHLVAPYDTDFSISSYLINKGLDLKATDNLGRTAFDYAARTGNTQILQNLLNKGVKPTGHALIIASQGGRSSSNTLETYKFLVETVKLKANATGENGENVLFNLVRKKDQSEIITYFLSKKVDVNAVDKSGTNAFMIAASTTNLDVVKQLLPKVKNINIINTKGETALYFAAQTGSSEILSYLIEKGAKTDLVSKNGNLAFALVSAYRAPRPGDNSNEFKNKLAILSAKGVDFSAKSDGSSLYHVAVAKNDIELFKALDGLKIDVNAKDQDGMTPLHRAAMMAKNDVVLKYLVEKGANKTVMTEFDETAFDLASDNEYLKQQNVKVDFLK
nr:ankyrin repeat domain-containing protein [uncultured Flavobacterium sp.]